MDLAHRAVRNRALGRRYDESLMFHPVAQVARRRPVAAGKSCHVCEVGADLADVVYARQEAFERLGGFRAAKTVRQQ